MAVREVGEEHWVQEGCTSLRLFVHGCVDIIKKAITDIDGVLGSFCHGFPETKLLWDGAVTVVVAVERIEGT